MIRRTGPRLLLAAGLGILVYYTGLWASLILSGGTDSADFTAFYTGWTIVLEGHGPQLYDPAIQATVQERILGGRAFEAGLNPFNNPPHLVLPFVLLALLPLNLSYLAWAVAQVALLGWLIWRLVTRVASTWSTAERLVLVGAAVALPSLALTLFQGAFSLLITVVIVEMYLALRYGHEGRAGIWLLMGSLKPQAVAGFGVMLVAAGRWRVIGSAAIAGLVSFVAASVVLGPAIWSSYLDFLGRYVESFDTFSVRPSVMWNVRGTLAIWFGPEIDGAEAALINDIALIVQVAGIAAIAVLWFRQWQPEAPAFRLRFAATILIGMLTSPHLNPHDGLLLIPAAALAYDASRGTQLGPWIGGVATAGPFLVLALNSLSVNEVGGPPLRVPVVLMIALLVLVLAALRIARPSQLTDGTVAAPLPG